jgi:hypothetical protein
MNPYILGLILIVVWRLWNLRQVWSIAKFHGEEWCFDARVARNFYTSGAGSAFLAAFRTRMAAGFSAELLVASVAYALDGPKAAFWAFAAAGAAGALYFSITCRRFAKEAWKYALPSDAPVPPKRLVDLKPRTATDYNSPMWIWALRAGTAAALIVLAVHCVTSTRPIQWASVVTIPVIVLYAQAGLLLIRRSLAEWRVCGIPEGFAEPALAWKSEARAFHIFCFEILRSWIVLFLLIWAFATAFPGIHPALQMFRHYFVWPLVVGSLALVLYRQRRCVAAAQQLRGAASPGTQSELPSQSFHLGGLVYHDSEQPAMFVRRGNFFAINLAHPRSQLLTAYLAGWLVVASATWKIS